MIAAPFGLPASGAPASRSGAVVGHAPASLACTVRMAPQREPQFDDELPPRHLSLVNPAPELPFPSPLPPVAPIGRRLTLAPLPVSPNDGAARRPRSTGMRRTERTGAPDPTRFGRQFAQGVVEVLSGRRPIVQLSRHVSPAVRRGLGRAGAAQPLGGPVAPVLHSLHLSEPAEGVCEMSAIVAVGPRFRAVAARLEWKLDHWLCTALQVG